MNQTVSMILWALLAFQIKHFLADFVLQTQRQVMKKGFYGHPAGLAHAALHGVGSIPALLILTDRSGALALMVAAEVVIHYHADWLKAQTDRRFHLSTQQHIYWVIFGLDQLVHQLTYVGILFVLFREGWTRF